MNRIRNAFWGILAGCLLFGMTAFAQGQAVILETYTGESDFSIYLKNAEAASEVNVQIATAEAEKVSVQAISELDMPMRTLVLVDNSLSIPSADRERIAELLQNLISDRLNQEEISIAVFSEETNILTDPVSDYGTLKKAIDSISWQDQETYLTDVLYDLLSEKYMQGTEDVYHRILIISDGVDNKSLGYTKDELYALLKEIHIPIYTIGCADKKNNEELENMFAISRMTGVDYFLLDEIEDVLEITEAMNRDREITRLTVTPPAELMDGSKKTLKITLADGTTLTAEIRMPQQVSAPEPEPEPRPEPEPEKEPEKEPKPEPEPEPVVIEREPAYIPFLIIGFIVVVVIAIIIVVILLLKKNKKKEPEFESIDDSLLKELQSSAGKADEKTEIMDSFQGRSSDDGKTVMIWNQNVTYQVVLTDVNSPARSFQVPLNQSVIVGRKSGICDIALEYEKSVSGKHCEISVRNGKFYIKDLQSSNGTCVNGSKILAETEIFSGNTLKLGRLEMRFEVR